MSLRIRGFIFFLVVYLAFTQPGLPACWLMAHACEAHPHLSAGHAGHSHSHDYLFQLTPSSTVQAAPVMLTPVALLIICIFSLNIWREIVYQYAWGFHWRAAQETPPPRAAFPTS